MKTLVKTYVKGCRGRAIYVLFAIDFFFIFATAVTGALAAAGVLNTIPGLLNIGREWSIPETLNYLKWIAIAAVFFVAFRSQRHALYAALAVIFFVLTLDDSLELHEQFGSFASCSLVGSDAYRDLMQIFFWGVMATLFLLVLARCFPRAPASVRATVMPMLVPFAGLAFFGVFVDFLHSFVQVGSLAAGLFILIEDGAELLLISSLVAYTLNHFPPMPDQANEI